jgi:hypothetical protein
VTVSRRSCSIVHLHVLALGCAVIAAANPSLARAADGPVITVGEPAGFSELAGKQTLLVDVYFGGVRRGEATIAASPGAVTIGHAAALVALLPPVTDRAAVEAALAAPDLPANAGLACSDSSDRARCGRLAPEVAGVILDRDRLRLDVFVNPRFLAVQDNVEQQYLPVPAGGPSLINAVGAVLSGRFGTGDRNYNFQDQLVLAKGGGRLRADLSYANGYGLDAERLALELDRPEIRYSAGALWAPGNELTGRRKLIGFGVESQIDTRLDKDELLGSPLVVYLDQRARVDVLRDGRVLGSAVYEAGNQQIDTSNLPDGSYEVVLRIDQPGQPTREERRFFTKSRQVPSVGRTDFFAFGGVLVGEPDRGSLKPSRDPYFQGEAIRRLTESWALEGGVQATDRTVSAQVAVTLLTQLARVRAAAVGNVHGGYGAILQLASSGTSRLNFNLDLRRIENDSADFAIVGQPPVPAASSVPFAVPPLAQGRTSFTQASGIVSYSLPNVRFLGVVSYRHDRHQAASYSIGPSLEADVLRSGPFTLTLRGDVTATDHGASGFAGLSLRLLGRRSSVTALAGARMSSAADDDVGEGPVAAVSGSWSAHAAGGELALGGGYEHQPRQDNMVLSSEFHHSLGSLSGDFVRTDGGGSAVSQYSVGMQTTLAVGGDTLRVAGKTTTDGMIVAHVAGAQDGDRFDVLVNEQFAGTIVGNRQLALALPSYRAYSVRIRPTGKDLLAYDSSPRSIGLYPGSVTRLDWKVAPVTIKFGRLVAPDGTPVRHASITGEGVWAETDEDGRFQIEAPNGAELTVTIPDGRSFTTTLPDGKPNGGIARLGSVTCCGLPELRLGALDPLSLPVQRGIR